MSRVAALLMLILIAACASDPAASTADPSDTVDPATVDTTDPPTDDTTPSSASTTSTTVTTSTTDAPTTTTSTTITSTTSPATSASTALLPDDAECEIEWVVPMNDTGHVTVARDAALFDVDIASGEYHCIAELDASPTRLDWNPGGDRLLVDDDVVLSADGPHPSGFAPGTAGITWSQPSGTALIAPSPDGGELLHVSADDPTDVIDVAALATTWSAAYHPSGLAIISAGIDDDGRTGLFIADNRGEGLQRLVFLEDTSTIITDVTVSADGGSVVFVHDHTGGSLDEGVAAHVHRLRIPELGLEELMVSPDVVPTGIVVSDGNDQTVAWSQPDATGEGTGQVWRIDGTTRPAAPSPERSSVVGILGIGDVVALVAPADRSAAGDVWLTPADGEPILIATGASAATARIIRPDTWQEPPLDVELQALG